MAQVSPSISPARAWFQLLRPPNLFTVPGDPLVGYLVANAGIIRWASLFAAMLSSLCLYATGLVLNDLADLAEDRAERPQRPLPSGAVPVRGAWLLSGGLALAGLGAAAATGSWAALVAAVVTLGALCLYNFWAKRIGVVGALTMGLCRAGSVMIGACAGPLALSIHGYRLGAMPAVLMGLYIAAVTNLARHETKPVVPKAARILPLIAVALAAAAGVYYGFNAPSRQPGAFLFLAALVLAAWLCSELFAKEEAKPLPALIGLHIRLLLVMQAGYCYLADPWALGPVFAGVLLLCWPLAAQAARRFYAS